MCQILQVERKKHTPWIKPHIQAYQTNIKLNYLRLDSKTLNEVWYTVGSITRWCVVFDGWKWQNHLEWKISFEMIPDHDLVIVFLTSTIRIPSFSNSRTNLWCCAPDLSLIRHLYNHQYSQQCFSDVAHTRGTSRVSATEMIIGWKYCVWI